MGRSFEPRAIAVRSIGRRALLLCLAWWSLGGFEGTGFVFGAIAIVVATCASRIMSGASSVTLRIGGVVRLMLVFVAGSLRGGWDVAWRALSPRQVIRPQVIRYATFLEQGLPQQLFTGIGAVMPGTLAIHSEEGAVDIHLLVDRGEVSRRELASLEASVAAALGLARPERRAEVGDG